MVRHYLTFNITDPLSEASRGSSTFTQYFSGTNAAGQINYVERKQATGGRFTVSVAGVEKTSGVDYTYSNTTGEITWTGHTPASGTDNIMLIMTAIKPWIYDDNPNVDTVHFPRISVLDAGTEHVDSGMGIYQSYNTGPGQYLTRRLKIIVRDRRNAHPSTFTYGSVHLLNYDLVQAIAQNIKAYFNTSASPPKWKFWRWLVVRDERIYSEEDVDGILRHDVTVDVSLYDSEGAI